MTQNVIERTIMWGDLDALGIVFYPRYYEWIDACGHHFFDKLGLNLGKLWSEHGIQFGLIETSCRYHQSGRYYQHIKIVTGIETLTKKTVHLAHRIYNREDEKLMVNGLEKRICMDVSDPKQFRAREIPTDLYSVLRQAVST